jgi:hypothetical protein
MFVVSSNVPERNRSSSPLRRRRHLDLQGESLGLFILRGEPHPPFFDHDKQAVWIAHRHEGVAPFTVGLFAKLAHDRLGGPRHVRRHQPDFAGVQDIARIEAAPSGIIQSVAGDELDDIPRVYAPFPR